MLSDYHFISYKHKPDDILFEEKLSEQLAKIIVRNVMLQITNSKPDT